ncbi:unnamed protein product [Mytilus coruscus]|uniref:Endonuclease/exonuclease/phosphatase domain-containing protein n=1 Tax=Mytilus coruscus TaxID=42192 RepID=A0A6J8ES38_MYTCO|nr:unnamed protein product [Mytilus coruscus]
MATGSDKEYREHLDKISSMIDKYEQTHNVFIVRDLNGTLMQSRNNNHDKLLKNFCSQPQLTYTVRNAHKPTFYRHNGNSTSQIDYILENFRGSNLLDSTIMDQNPLNSSAHVPVKAKTNLIIKGKTKMISTTSKKKTILKWEETNIENYQQKVNQVRKKTEMQNETDVERQAINIMDILQEATELSVVKKIVALKGPKWKASQKVKECIEKNKKAFYAWKQKDRPKNEENTEYQEMKKHKRELRKQIGKEDHIDKQNFYNKLMDEHDSKAFTTN